MEYLFHIRDKISYPKIINLMTYFQSNVSWLVSNQTTSPTEQTKAWRSRHSIFFPTCEWRLKSFLYKVVVPKGLSSIHLHITLLSNRSLSLVISWICLFAAASIPLLGFKIQTLTSNSWNFLKFREGEGNPHEDFQLFLLLMWLFISICNCFYIVQGKTWLWKLVIFISMYHFRSKSFSLLPHLINMYCVNALLGFHATIPRVAASTSLKYHYGSD